MPGHGSDRRLALGLAAAVLLCIVAALVTFPPNDLYPVETTFDGLPRLGLYLLAGIVLAATGAAVPAWGHGERIVSVGNGRWLAGWLALAVLLAVFNARRLRDDIADPSGPWLWLASMALVVIAVSPSLPHAIRRIHVPRRRPHALWLVLAGVFLLAVVVRFVDLGGVPPNVQADEGDRAASALDVLDGTALPSWFDSGWFYISMVYFRVLAAFFEVFGVGVVQGRALNAVAGVVVVAAVAWIGFRHFGRRFGLVATALAATSPFALQFSRTIAESGVAAALLAVSLAGFLEGGRSGRPWAFAVAGLTGALSLYTYPSGRTWPILATGTMAILLLFGRGRRRTLAVGAGVAAAAALVAVLPYAVHLTQHSDEVTDRFDQTTVLSATNRGRLTYMRPDMPMAEVLTLQVERSLGMFDRYQDGSDFLPTGKPVLPKLLAVLTLLGVFYATARGVVDARHAILALWFWVALSGVVLTVETPAAQRAAGIVVTLPLLASLALCELAARIPSLVGAARRRWGRAPATAGLRRHQLARVGNVLVGLVVVGLMGVQLWSYFVDYRGMTDPWSAPTNEGRAIAALGEIGPVYALERQHHQVRSGWVRFLARGVRTGPIAYPAAQLPILVPDEPSATQEPPFPVPAPRAGETMSFVLYGPEQLAYVGYLRDLYGKGVLLPTSAGRTTFQVPPHSPGRERGVRLRRDGRTIATVSTFGALPDGTSPGRLAWSAGVRVARTGIHRFELTGPRATRLLVDGVVVAERGGRGTTRGVLRLPQGLHFVQIVAPVASPTDRVALRWADGAVGTRPRPFTRAQAYPAMTAPWGLLNRVIAQQAGDGGVTGGTRVSLDAGLAAGFVDAPAQLPYPARVTWDGELLAPRAGPYRMAFLSDVPLDVVLDGRPLDAAARDDAIARGIVLAAGRHRVEVALRTTAVGPTYVRWLWVPPTRDGRLDLQASWSVVPPSVLRPETPVDVVETG